MPLTVDSNTTTIQPPNVYPTVIPPPVVVPPQTVIVSDASMVAALEGEGYTVTAPATGTTPPPPPVVTGKPLWVEYHGNTSDPDSTVPIGGMLDYGDNNASSFTWTQARIAYFANRLEIIKMGMPLTQQQCVTFGQGCVAAGHPSPVVPWGWENNQDVWETWNEKKFTAAQFKAQFLQQCAWADSVAGFSPHYAWCPNLNQAGNQAAGRTQFDTNPGVGTFKNPIVMAPDGYDNPGDLTDTANIIAQCELYEANAKANGQEFWGLCETGDNGSDDAKFWTDLLTHAQSAGWKFVTNFAVTTSQGGSFNSTIGPKSIAAVEAFYA